MNYLTSGMESKERFNLLLSLTSIKSESQISALEDYLVRGFSEQDSASLNDVSQSNFNRALKRMNEVAEIVEKIKDIDFEKISKAI